MPVLSAPTAATHELPHARFTSLATPSRGACETSVWRVEIAPGSPATPHQVTREETFVILSGSARVKIAGEEAEAKRGDVIVIPPHTTFEIAALGDEALHALCCFPVGGKAKLGGRVFTPPWAE
jgi:quercetin dioxygenase-like cupin family protein